MTNYLGAAHFAHPSQGIDEAHIIGALLSRINYLEKVTIGDLKAKVKELEAKLEATKPEKLPRNQYKFEINSKLTTGIIAQVVKGILIYKPDPFDNLYRITIYDRDVPESILYFNHEDIQTIVTALQKVLDDGVLNK